jgi:hypothetical protein
LGADQEEGVFVKFEPKSVMHGVPALKVRDILRKLPFGDSVGDWERASSGLSEREAEDLLNGLRVDGYVEPCEDGFRLTQKGNRFAVAKARGIKRVTADRMLADIVDRAKQINSDAKYCYVVRALVVFGSYLDDTKMILGDLDMGFFSEGRHSQGPCSMDEYVKASGARHDAHMASIARAVAGGRRFSTFIDRMCWPKTEFVRALKGGSPGLSLHDIADDDERAMVLAGPHHVVFGSLPEEDKCANLVKPWPGEDGIASSEDRRDWAAEDKHDLKKEGGWDP